jgi:threonine aldolase
MSPQELARQCHTFMSGHRPRKAAQDYAAMAAWCEANDVAHDQYGEGPLVQDFEARIAALLGYEAGVFCISGTMAQLIALRLGCQGRGRKLVALHPSAHILRHELANYQMMEVFNVLEVGDPFRTWEVSALTAWPERFGAALYELPMREIGGQLPPWEALQALKAGCKERDIHLHMDGARLWEAGAGYARPLAEIAQGFDSAYVSFYKGIGGLGGAMLLGSRAFVDEAKVWIRRQGGHVFRRSPYVVAAAMHFDQRLAAMPAWLARTRWLYGELRAFACFRPNPAQPQCNMLHIHVPLSREALTTIRDRLAREHGIWLFGGASHGALPKHSYFEWYVGENLMEAADARVREILAQLAGEIAQVAE